MKPVPARKSAQPDAIGNLLATRAAAREMLMDIDAANTVRRAIMARAVMIPTQILIDALGPDVPESKTVAGLIAEIPAHIRDTEKAKARKQAVQDAIQNLVQRGLPWTTVCELVADL